MKQRKFKCVVIVAQSLILLAFHLKMMPRKELRVSLVGLALILLTQSYQLVARLVKSQKEFHHGQLPLHHVSSLPRTQRARMNYATL